MKKNSDIEGHLEMQEEIIDIKQEGDSDKIKWIKNIQSAMVRRVKHIITTSYKRRN